MNAARPYNPDAATRDSLIRQATEFLQARHALEGGCPQTMTQRVGEIESSIRRSGTYTHRPDELEFGARLAWRNSNRCIGRHFWRQLDVFDCRHVKSQNEVCASLEAHLRIAFNEGRVKNCITIFPPRSVDRPDEVEIINHQLVRYACFDVDGKKVGDPASAELTQRAIQSGWTPANVDRFVPLPWLLKIRGELTGSYDVFQQKPELLREVELEHPENQKFKALGLKWYALPVISDMVLVIGGIVYPCAPFNGWYMGTEIGARNLADVGRYDCLRDVAKVFKLDLSSDRSLWKDRAIVELNRAVLYSFDRSEVRIGDHHALTEQFDKFCKSEAASRCPVTGDWSWLVPPISGSLTPPFFEEYDPKEIDHTNFFLRTKK